MQRHTRGKMWKGWWLFHATDFQSLMYPCFTLCRILGIFPYKLKASTFEASKPHYILSTVISCVSCVSSLIFIYDIIISKISVGDIVKSLQVINYYMLSNFMVIIAHVLSGARMRLLQIILTISSKLPPESYQKLSRLIHVKDIFAIILKVAQVLMNFSQLQGLQLNCFFVSIAVFTIYAALLEMQINMLYINCVCVLKACFKTINDNLAHMQKRMINDIKRCDLRLICHVNRNQILLLELKTWKKQHMMVSDAVQMLNTIFNLHLLATIIITFSTTTVELYYYAVRWEDGAFITLDRKFLDVLSVSMAYNIIKMTLLVWACETGKNQAQEIGTTIHDLLNSTNDEQIKKELHLFSLQILHRKNTFSAKGVTVDATLLVSIVSTITTYLLILIQFLNMSHSCDGKTTISVI